MGKVLSTRALFVAVIAFLDVAVSSADVTVEKSGFTLLLPRSDSVGTEPFVGMSVRF